MISHRSQMDDENMTHDVSEENKSIVCRRLYVIMRLRFYFLLRPIFHARTPTVDPCSSRWGGHGRLTKARDNSALFVIDFTWCYTPVITQNIFNDTLDIDKRFVFFQMEFVFVNIHVA